MGRRAVRWLGDVAGSEATTGRETELARVGKRVTRWCSVNSSHVNGDAAVAGARVAHGRHISPPVFLRAVHLHPAASRLRTAARPVNQYSSKAVMKRVPLI